MRSPRAVRRSWLLWLPGMLLPLLAPAQETDDAWAERRAALVRELRADARYAGDLVDGGFLPEVLRAIAVVPRHEFVPEGERAYAYANRPLPIGHGQTISQPYIVALMTHLVRPQPDHVVLEVGTGSGYQAAILATLVDHVYTIEIVEPLLQEATARLERLGYDNVTTRLGDGYHGWEEHAPFDAIVVTAAASHVPPPLVRQLKPGGRMVIPVGGRFVTQELLLIEKTAEGELVTRQVAPVRFVPLTGEH
ncbi:MAG TPA: protein-L-isoaspartate(D-aspartate) O-methyltransferase [Woeseiaceae bacterium]|nr:protein-L-isoaspartate(D-aspartate) O-methyltransferase [Woeseiaceae bacterium]